MITNTHSVGVVRDAVIEWVVRAGRMQSDEWSLPVVAETWDGGLNDINGFHVTKQDAWAALDSARGGPSPRAASGRHGHGVQSVQGRIGTPPGGSRQRTAGTRGCLGAVHYGRRRYLRIAGAPVGQEIADLVPWPHLVQRSAVRSGSGHPP